MTEAPGTHNPQFLPPDIPVPQDDGAARHLTGMKLPDLGLPATEGQSVILSKLKGRTVIYVYPRTGVHRRLPNLARCLNGHEACGFGEPGFPQAR